jgi:pSer/pThr/pTyr-binding forkhead associated (FHA) protein
MVSVPAPGGTDGSASTHAPGAQPTSAGAAPSVGPSPTAAGQARLQTKRYGALTGEEIPLLGERVVIGRFDPETGPVDIDLSSIPETQHISRQHGEMYREADGRWFIRDLGSTNGIFVKHSTDTSFGQRITQPQAIGNGDELAFGNARFVFRTE